MKTMHNASKKKEKKHTTKRALGLIYAYPYSASGIYKSAIIQSDPIVDLNCGPGKTTSDLHCARSFGVCVTSQSPANYFHSLSD
jgi:hypothetical protein